MQLQAVPPDYTEERNKKYLYFWGDYPHWLVTNEPGKKVLELLFKGSLRKTLISFYQKAAEVSEEEAKADVTNFLKPLIQTGVVHEKGNPPTVPSVKTQFSLETAAKNIASIVMNPTRACNYRCTHCYTEAGTPLPHELTCSEIISILKQAAPLMRPRILGFLGGEPLLRKKDVLKASEYWIRKEKGYASVSTNGSLIDQDFARKAEEINLRVQISMDGASPETSDAVRGKGSHANAIRGAKILVNHKVRTWLCMVYHRENLSELENFITLGLELGVQGVRFIPLNYLGRGASSHLVKVMPSEMVRKVLEILRKHPEWGDFIDQSFFSNICIITRSVPRYVYCGSGLSTLLVESNGDLYPCINLVYPEFRVGNLREKKFADLWFHSPILERIRSLCVEDANPICCSCTFRYLCGMGCRSEIYALTSRINLPTFFCESWKRALIEMCWVLDEFPNLHERVTLQRQTWPSQSEPLVDLQAMQKLMEDI